MFSFSLTFVHVLCVFETTLPSERLHLTNKCFVLLQLRNPGVKIWLLCIKPILEGSSHLWLEQADFSQMPSSDAEWRCPFEPWSLNAEMEIPLRLLCQPIKRNQKGICCDFCNRMFHTCCCAVDGHTYDILSISSCSWICCDCGITFQTHSSTPA